VITPACTPRRWWNAHSVVWFESSSLPPCERNWIVELPAASRVLEHRREGLPLARQAPRLAFDREPDAAERGVEEPRHLDGSRDRDPASRHAARLVHCRGPCRRTHLPLAGLGGLADAFRLLPAAFPGAGIGLAERQCFRHRLLEAAHAHPLCERHPTLAPPPVGVAREEPGQQLRLEPGEAAIAVGRAQRRAPVAGALDPQQRAQLPRRDAQALARERGERRGAGLPLVLARGDLAQERAELGLEALLEPQRTPQARVELEGIIASRRGGAGRLQTREERAQEARQRAGPGTRRGPRLRCAGQRRMRCARAGLGRESAGCDRLAPIPRGDIL